MLKSKENSKQRRQTNESNMSAHYKMKTHRFDQSLAATRFVAASTTVAARGFGSPCLLWPFVQAPCACHELHKTMDNALHCQSENSDYQAMAGTRLHTKRVQWPHHFRTRRLAAESRLTWEFWQKPCRSFESTVASHSPSLESMAVSLVASMCTHHL